MTVRLQLREFDSGLMIAWVWRIVDTDGDVVKYMPINSIHLERGTALADGERALAVLRAVRATGLDPSEWHDVTEETP